MSFRLFGYVLVVTSVLGGLCFAQDLADDLPEQSLNETGVVNPVQPQPPPAVLESEVAKPASSFVSKPVSPIAVKPSQNDALAHMQYQNGASLQFMGRVVSWSGVAGMVLGTRTGNATLASVGLIGWFVGMPLNGSGSNKMVDATNQMNPSTHVTHRGWPVYYTGMGLFGGGLALILNSVDEDGYVENHSQADMGSTMMLAGMICSIVGWYKFSASADDAEIVHSSLQFSVAPLIVPDSNNESGAAGLQLSASF